MRHSQLEEKLIRDGGDKARLRINLISMAIACCLLFAAAICLGLKILVERHADQEPFFFLPISALFSFCGTLAFAITGIRSTVFLLKSQRKAIRRRYLAVCLGCSGMVLSYAAAVAFLIAANTGKELIPVALACALAAAASLLAALIFRISAPRCSKST